MVKTLYGKTIPERCGPVEIQILTPQIRGSLGTQNLNQLIQQAFNLQTQELKNGERVFKVGDRVIQTRNNYDKFVFNGDIGIIQSIDFIEGSLVVAYPLGKQKKEVFYEREDILELSLAYAITVHKSQGSEFDAVIFPILTQHFKMLYRNLVYTGLTRAKKLAVLVGSRRAFSIAIRSEDQRKRQTYLQESIESLMKEL